MIYICEYDNSTANHTLLEAAEKFFRNENILSIKEDDKTGIRWIKLRERILAWMLLEYALRQECAAWMGCDEDAAWTKCDKTAGWAEKVEVRQEKRCASEDMQQPVLWKSGSFVDKLDIVRTEYGKPYSSRYPKLFFNISHCDTACACVISDYPAGIDIERKFEYKENLKRHVCCEEELRVLEQLRTVEKCDMSDASGVPEKSGRSDAADAPGDPAAQLRFLWSMKEAFVKLDGRGLGYGLKNMNLAGLLPVSDGICGEENLVFRVKAAEHYTLAACSRQKNPGEIHVVSERELMKVFSGVNEPE